MSLIKSITTSCYLTDSRGVHSGAANMLYNGTPMHKCTPIPFTKQHVELFHKDRVTTCSVANKRYRTVAVLGWGQGGTAPPQISPRPPKFLIGSRGVSGVYRRIAGTRHIPTSRVFWQRIITSLVIIKTGYTGIYALTVNKWMCIAPCHTKLLNFFRCTFCLTGLLTILVKGIAIINTNTFSNTLSQLIKHVKTVCIIMLGIYFECLPSNFMHLIRWLW